MGSYTFLDTDEIIEKAVDMTITEIFEKEGEDVFRDVESQVLNTVYAYIRCVISTGGGIVCKRDNWSKLQSGIVVWLDVDPTIIVQRIEGNTNRPLLLNTDNRLQTIQNLLEQRQSMYMNADVRVQVTDINETEDSVADRVVKDIHDYSDDHPPAWKQAKVKAQAEGLDWVR
jgi:shikimate kinase